MENGVWRTVGGRRIFIKEGQDLASAMKESGKFKNNQAKINNELYKNVVQGKEINDEELTDVNEIIKRSSALPSVKTGGRQKTSPCNRLVIGAS